MCFEYYHNFEWFLYFITHTLRLKSKHEEAFLLIYQDIHLSVVYDGPCHHVSCSAVSTSKPAEWEWQDTVLIGASRLIKHRCSDRMCTQNFKFWVIMVTCYRIGQDSFLEVTRMCNSWTEDMLKNSLKKNTIHLTISSQF